jgi:hypothetical protein
VTGDLAGEELFRLHKYFLQVHAGVTNQQIVTDPAGELTIGTEHRVPFLLTGADLNADLIVVCPVPEALRLRLEAPDGSVLDSSAGVATVAPLQGPWLAGLRLTLPVVPGSTTAGRWTALLSLDEGKLQDLKDRDIGDDAIRRRGALPYSAIVTARSDVELEVHARRREDRARLVATLNAFGLPLWEEARVMGLVTDPFGRLDRVRFKSSGEGRYVARLDVPDSGLYSIRVVAEGSVDGDRFTREQLVSIATVTGEPSEDSTKADEEPRRPRPRPRRRPALGAALRTAKAPLPPPEPEQISDEAFTTLRHAHGGGLGSHFPSAEEVAKPDPWEVRGKSAKKRAAKKATGRSGRRKTRRPSTDHDH